MQTEHGKDVTSRVFMLLLLLCYCCYCVSCYCFVTKKAISWEIKPSFQLRTMSSFNNTPEFVVPTESTSGEFNLLVSVIQC